MEFTIFFSYIQLNYKMLLNEYMFVFDLCSKINEITIVKPRSIAFSKIKVLFSSNSAHYADKFRYTPKKHANEQPMIQI